MEFINITPRTFVSFRKEVCEDNIWFSKRTRGMGTGYKHELYQPYQPKDLAKKSIKRLAFVDHGERMLEEFTLSI